MTPQALAAAKFPEKPKLWLPKSFFDFNYYGIDDKRINVRFVRVSHATARKWRDSDENHEEDMYRVFVAQSRGGALHFEFSQNVLFSIRKMNRKLEKRKRRDRWRLVWFSDAFELNEARRVVEKLKRVNSIQAMRAVMAECTREKADSDGEESSLAANVSALSDFSSGF